MSKFFVNKSAKKYINALMEYAKGKNTLEAVNKDMSKLKSFYESKSGNAKMSKVFEDALKILPYKKQLELIAKLEQDLELHKITVNFIKVLVLAKDMFLLANIVLAWQELFLEYEGYTKIEVTTAIQMSEEIEALLNKELEKVLNKFYLSKIVKEDIVGGMIIKIHSKTYDDSIKSKIFKIQNIQNI